MRNIKVLVCGGRDFGIDVKERRFIFDSLNQFLSHVEKDSVQTIGMIITGGARGVDTVAEEWAQFEYIPSTIYYAHWKLEGKKAGILRNIRMLEKEQPDYVLAFPGGKGTEHMKTIARKAGVIVIEYDYKV